MISTAQVGRWMRDRIGPVARVLAASLLGLAIHGQATASCGQPAGGPAPQGQSHATGLTPAVFRRVALVTDYDREDGQDSIVGLWQFKLSGFNVDWGLQSWHSDGTEIMFSGAQNPETGDVCQGVWRKIAPYTYTLNHIAMGWLAPGAGFGLRIHFHFVVKLDPSGNSFSGTYRVAAYQETPNDPFDESPSLEGGSGTGTVTATRVRPD